MENKTHMWSRDTKSSVAGRLGEERERIAEDSQETNRMIRQGKRGSRILRVKEKVRLGSLFAQGPPDWAGKVALETGGGGRLCRQEQKKNWMGDRIMHFEPAS